MQPTWQRWSIHPDPEADGNQSAPTLCTELRDTTRLQKYINHHPLSKNNTHNQQTPQLKKEPHISPAMDTMTTDSIPLMIVSYHKTPPRPTGPPILFEGRRSISKSFSLLIPKLLTYFTPLKPYKVRITSSTETKITATTEGMPSNASWIITTSKSPSPGQWRKIGSVVYLNLTVYVKNTKRIPQQAYATLAIHFNTSPRIITTTLGYYKLNQKMTWKNRSGDPVFYGENEDPDTTSEEEEMETDLKCRTFFNNQRRYTRHLCTF